MPTTIRRTCLCLFLLPIFCSLNAFAPAASPKYWEALKAFNTGDLEEALRISKSLLEEDKTNTKAFRLLIRASKNKLEETRRFIDQLIANDPRNPNLYYALGLFYKQNKQRDPAFTNLKQCIGLGPHVGQAYLEIAELADPFAQSDSVVDYLTFLTRTNPSNSNAYLGLGLCYRLKGNLPKALQYLDQAINVDATNIFAYKAEGEIFWQQRQFKKYLEVTKKMQASVGGRIDPETEMDLIFNLGKGYAALNDYQRALPYVGNALRLSQQLNDSQLGSKILLSLGVIHNTLENIDLSLKYYEQAYEITQKSGDKLVGSEALLSRGNIYFLKLNDYSRAYEIYTKVLELKKALHDEEGVGVCYRNIGFIKEYLGDVSTAIDLYKLSLERIKRDVLREQTYILLGSAYLKNGDYNLALKFLRQAQDLVAKSDNKLNMDRVEGVIGALYKRLKDYPKAHEQFSKALKAARQTKNRQREGFWLRHLGDTCTELGRRKEARKFYYASLKIGKELGYEDIIWEAYQAIGGLDEKYNDLSAALDHYEQALSLFEPVRKRLSSEGGRLGFFEDKVELYGRIIGLLLRKHAAESNKRFQDRSFHYSERAKARVLMEMFPQRELINELEIISSDFRTRFLQIETNLTGKRLQLIAEKTKRRTITKPASETIESINRRIMDLEIEIEKLDGERATFIENIKEKHPQFKFLTEPAILTAEQVQQGLDDKEVFIEYFVAEDKTFAFVLQKDKTTVEILPIGRSELTKRLKSISTVFSSQNTSLSARAWKDFRLDLLKELYEKIFQPLEGSIPPAAKLIIVRDDILNLLPFEMLVDELTNGKTRFLIEKYPISYAYSASLLNTTRKYNVAERNSNAGNRIADSDLLAFGKPDLNGRSVADTERFAAIPYSEKELRMIKHIVRKSKVLTDRDATESEFKKSAGQYRVIHLATHSVLDSLSPLYSRIVFALNPSLDQKGEDGSLYTYEIFGLSLNADMVVLSACQSGLGRLRRGEGLEGLSGAFFYAGARSLVVSLWPIADSEATVEIMQAFYENLAQGTDKATALQKAKLKLIGGRKYDDPYLWAAFILIGDTASVRLRKPVPWTNIIASIALIGCLSVCIVVWYRARIGAHRRNGMNGKVE